MVVLRRSARLLGSGSAAAAAVTQEVVNSSTSSSLVVTTKSSTRKPRAASSPASVATTTLTKTKSSRKRSASRRQSDTIDGPPPFIPQPVLDVEVHRVHMAANLELMSSVKSETKNENEPTAVATGTILNPTILKGVHHLLQTDPSLPALLGPEWKADLFAPLSNAEPDTGTDNSTIANIVMSDQALLSKYYQHMARGILAQQISGAAARSIVRKFKLLFHNLPEPSLPHTTHAIPTSVPDYEALWETLNSQTASKSSTAGNDDDNDNNDTQVSTTTSGYFDDSRLSFPHPYQVVHTAPELLRSAGLSARKVEYVVGLSQAFLGAYEKLEGQVSIRESSEGNDEENESEGSQDKKSTKNTTTSIVPFSVQLFKNGSDTEIEQALVALKGIGPWSAEMFLLFGLARLDVFSRGDLGIQRGLARYLVLRPEVVSLAKAAREEDLNKSGNNVKKKKNTGGGGGNKKLKWKMPEEHEFEYVRQKFAPYGSLLMLVLWKLGGMPDMDALEGPRKRVKNEE
ncbi:uncharacterized protein SAPINGB_P000783 [Magnusiomyces paraingens]|uniref:HhH-GPD domain-containing protein n=1 Tax=Magnusiomyces paraingens TaxID=2606893 RepID=A0A5E8B8F2_9ASCO|nr:uncharacterized protein SAPINGB_P000783 [Saprochaete ingens]VVT45537.1 unnamed protein product [Saprochaete ingens]